MSAMHLYKHVNFCFSSFFRLKKCIYIYNVLITLSDIYFAIMNG